MEKTLQEQLTEVESQLDQEKAKGAQKDSDVITHLEDQQATILKQMDDETAKAEQEAAQMVRIQAQEEKVESITLPDNFNDVFGDPLANDIIIEVIKDFQRQANAEHNAEVENLVATHKEEIRASSEREVQLQRQNNELQDDNRQLTEKYGNIQDQLYQASLDLKDAESKRDAAVRDKEAAESLLAEKQAHIDTLRAEIAVGAKNAINVTNINPSDRLAALVEQSKNAKIKSAQDLALENDVPFRGKVLVDGVVAPPIALEVPTFPNQADDTSHQLDQTESSPIPADHQEVGAPTTFPVQSGNEMDTGTSSTDGQSQSAVTREEHESLKARVDSIENKLNVQAVA